MAFVSYAQNFEDVMLWRALGHVQRGSYIDLGAAEPVADSVTCAFYERGWRGINVEPGEAPFRRLVAARPDDVNLQVAVGREAGEQTFFSIDGDNGLSTLDADLARRHSATGRTALERTVHTMTLAQICERHVTGPVHFLKIDVEGSERAVLEGADFRRWRPWVVLVEATEPNSQVPNHAGWEDLLLAAAYRFVRFDGLNRFYVAEERHDALAPAFATPPNVFDDFVRWPEQQARTRAEAAEAGLGDARARLLAAAEQVDQAQARVNVAQERLDEAHARLHAATARADETGERADALVQELEAARAAAARQAAERVDSARLLAERDAYAQELFESDRHAAVLASARQTLLDENGNQRVAIERLEALQGELRGKVEELERNRLANEDRIGIEIRRTEALGGELEETRRREREAREAQVRTAAELDDWRGLANRLHASTSWRLTRPVRLVRRLVGGRGG